MFTDPIADMLTRVRNGLAVHKAVVLLPYSKMKLSLANVLVAEGYLGGVTVHESSAFAKATADRFKTIEVKLKYDSSGDPVIMEIHRVSKPGQRIYAPSDKIPKANGGTGITVLSTSQGLMTDRAARKAKTGGEVLCQVW